MIRDFKKEDCKDFINMADSFYHSSAVLHAVPQAYFETTFELIMNKSPFVRGIMFEMGGKTAGYALLSKMYSNEVGSFVIWIEEAYILDDFRGYGLGSELFCWLEQEYKDTVKRFRLEVTKSNLGAIKLYEKLGYQHLDYLQMVKE